MKLLLPFLCFFSSAAFAQVGIKADNTAPISSAQLEVQSTNKAFYPPRMTNAQVKAIASPQVGAVVYDTDLNCLSMYNGTAWVCTGSGSGGMDPNGGSAGTVPGVFSLSKMNANTNTGVQLQESAFDASGNMYMTGFFGNGAPAILYNLDGSPALTFTSAGVDDGFVAELSPAGTMSWGARLAGAGEDVALSVATDATGVTVAGYFASTPMTIYNGKANDAATETAWGTLGSAGTGDGFIIRYNLSGVVQWVARQSASVTMDRVQVSSDGTYIYAFSSAQAAQLTVYNGRSSSGAGEVLWGTTSTAVSAASGAVVKYAVSTGAVQWVAKTEGSLVYADDIVNSGAFIYILTDASANFQPYNARTTAVAAETGWGATTTAGGDDIYLVQLNASTGAVNWVARAAGGGTDYGVKVTADLSGNVVMTGYGINTPATPFYIRQARTLSANAEVNWGQIKTDFDNGKMAYIAKYNAAGNVQWAAHIGGSSTAYPALTDVSIDRTGNVYVCGGHGPGSCDIYNGKTAGTDAETIYQTMPYSAVARGWLIKYTFGGKVQWISKISTFNNAASAEYTTISNYQPTTNAQPILFGGGAYLSKIILGSSVITTTSTNQDLFWIKYISAD